MAVAVSRRRPRRRGGRPRAPRRRVDVAARRGPVDAARRVGGPRGDITRSGRTAASGRQAVSLTPRVTCRSRSCPVRRPSRPGRARVPTTRRSPAVPRRCATPAAATRSSPGHTSRATSRHCWPSASTAPSTPSSFAATRRSHTCSGRAPTCALLSPVPSTRNSLARLPRARRRSCRSSTAPRSRHRTASRRHGRSCSQPAASLVPSGPIAALAGDVEIEQLLNGDGTPALRAQHVLSALALVALEDPTARRAITILNPNDLDPATELLDAMLTGLRGNPLLDPMTVDEVFATVAGEGRRTVRRRPASSRRTRHRLRRSAPRATARPRPASTTSARSPDPPTPSCCGASAPSSCASRRRSRGPQESLVPMRR